MTDLPVLGYVWNVMNEKVGVADLDVVLLLLKLRQIRTMTYQWV